MLFGNTNELDAKNRELAQLRKDQAVADAHRNEIEAMEKKHRAEIEDLKEHQRDELETQRTETASLEAKVEKLENKVTNLEEQLKYEKSNREVIIKAEVDSQVGRFETKYYHDLHTGLEARADKMHSFQESTLKEVLSALKELKPGDARVMILDKSTGDTKGGGEKKQS